VRCPRSRPFGTVSLFKPRRIKHLVVAAITELAVHRALLLMSGFEKRVSLTGDRGFESISRYPDDPLETPYFLPFLERGRSGLVTGFSNKKEPQTCGSCCLGRPISKLLERGKVRHRFRATQGGPYPSVIAGPGQPSKAIPTR
jgi:hypothetical protein